MMLWRIRKYFIQKLVGRQTIVMNTRIIFSHQGFNEYDIDIGVMGHHKKYISENIEIRNLSGNTIKYGDK